MSLVPPEFSRKPRKSANSKSRFFALCWLLLLLAVDPRWWESQHSFKFIPLDLFIHSPNFLFSLIWRSRELPQGLQEPSQRRRSLRKVRDQSAPTAKTSGVCGVCVTSGGQYSAHSEKRHARRDRAAARGSRRKEREGESKKSARLSL